MLKSLSSLLSVNLQVLSDRLCTLPVHWFGRSVICSGEDCPACSFRSPRMVYYCGCNHNRQRSVMEVPSSFADCIDHACRTLGLASPIGVCMQMSRSSKRDTWALNTFKHLPLSMDAVGEVQVAREVATAMRVATPIASENWRSWLQRIRPTQSVVLRSCVLFAENGSHQMAQVAR